MSCCKILIPIPIAYNTYIGIIWIDRFISIQLYNIIIAFYDGNFWCGLILQTKKKIIILMLQIVYIKSLLVVWLICLFSRKIYYWCRSYFKDNLSRKFCRYFIESSTIFVLCYNTFLCHLQILPTRNAVLVCYELQQ